MGIFMAVSKTPQPVSVRLCVVCLCAAERRCFVFINIKRHGAVDRKTKVRDTRPRAFTAHTDLAAWFVKVEAV